MFNPFNESSKYKIEGEEMFHWQTNENSKITKNRKFPGPGRRISVKLVKSKTSKQFRMVIGISKKTARVESWVEEIHKKDDRNWKIIK